MPKDVENPGVIECGPSQAVKDPRFAKVMLEILALYSRLEVSLGALMVELSGSDPQKAEVMYFAVENEKAKQDMILALARKQLPDEYCGRLERLMKRMRDKNAYRNAIAHSEWCTCRDRPDELFTYPYQAEVGRVVRDKERELERFEALKTEIQTKERQPYRAPTDEESIDHLFRGLKAYPLTEFQENRDVLQSLQEDLWTLDRDISHYMHDQRRNKASGASP